MPRTVGRRNTAYLSSSLRTLATHLDDILASDESVPLVLSEKTIERVRFTSALLGEFHARATHLEGSSFVALKKKA